MFLGNLTEEQRLSKAVVAIMQNPKYTALAGVLMIGDRTITDDPNIPTACTNGRDEMYNRTFVSKLNDPELRFLVLHEVYHKLYKHLITWQDLHKEDANKANIACDYVINIKLVDDNEKDKFATMTGELARGCLSEEFRGMNSAQVYKLLGDTPPPPPPPQGYGRTNGGVGQVTNDQGQAQQPLDIHDWDGAKELTADEKRELERDLDEAIRQGAMVAGKMGSGGDRELAELLQPQVNWREALREFVQTTCAGNDYSTWRRPNRRYVSAGIYMPSGVSEQVGELIVAIDTSGSIGSKEVSIFLSEVKAICDTVHPDAVRLLYWDTQVCGDEKYDVNQLDSLVQSTKPKGGGGTDVTCVTDYIRDKNINAQAAIILTDGYLFGGWGQWSLPVLWAIVDHKHARPSVGKAVHIRSEVM